MNVQTVGSGKTYSTLASWEDAVDDLAADDQVADCYPGADLGVVSILGWTEGSTCTIRANADNRHGGDFTAGPYINFNSADGITHYDSYIPITIDGIRFKNTTTGTSPRYTAINVYYNTNAITIKNNLIEFAQAATNTTSGQGIGGSLYSNDGPTYLFQIFNNVIVNAVTGIGMGYANSYAAVTDYLWEVWNNTIHTEVAYTYAGAAGILLYQGQYSSETRTTVVKNNVVTGYTNQSAYAACFAVASGQTYIANNNASSDVTGDDMGATGSLVSQTASDLYADKATLNFFAKAAGPLEGAGANLSAKFTTDAAGQTRSAWSIGALEGEPAEDGPSMTTAASIIMAG